MRMHTVETESVTVRDRMIYVMDLFEHVEQVEFSEIFQIGHLGVPSRSMLVATFLAMLELARLGALHIFQGLGDVGAPEGPIRLRVERATPDGPSWHERITESM